MKHNDEETSIQFLEFRFVTTIWENKQSLEENCNVGP